MLGGLHIELFFKGLSHFMPVYGYFTWTCYCEWMRTLIDAIIIAFYMIFTVAYVLEKIYLIKYVKPQSVKISLDYTNGYKFTCKLGTICIVVVFVV